MPLASVTTEQHAALPARLYPHRFEERDGHGVHVAQRTIRPGEVLTTCYIAEFRRMCSTRCRYGGKGCTQILTVWNFWGVIENRL